MSSIDDFTRGLFPTNYNNIGYNIPDENNNKIINESIISDILNSNNKNALLEFYNNIGSFGARDGLLNESAATDIELESFDNCNTPECSSILAVAKESNDDDYKVYTKCIMLMQKCLENMKTKYGNIAKERLETQKQIVESNPRIQDAIEKTQEACCKAQESCSGCK